MSTLRALVAEKVRTGSEAVAPFVQSILDSHVEEISAIVFYGSLLSIATKTSTSFHDFYVIIDSHRSYHPHLRDRVLGSILPPSVYYRVFRGPGGAELRCKICVLTARQLLRETSPRARDIHNMGRFSKRVAIVHARDQAAQSLIVDACLQASRTLRSPALSLLPARFSLDDFIRTLLKLSYLGEQRIAEDAKVAALMSAELEYYRALYAAILAEAGYEPDSQGIYTQAEPIEAMRQQTEAFLQRSRRRGKMRWPKYILTVDSWLDILVAKIERNHGIRIELSERERRWPLIFGWPKYFAFKRRGIVK